MDSANIQELQADLVSDEYILLVDHYPELNIKPEAVQLVNETLQFVQTSEQAETIDATEDDNKCSDQKQRYSADEMMETNKILHQEFQNKVMQNSETYQKMLEERQRLPAWEMKDFITAAVKRHKVIIVSGVTGCGKTTQVPQFILDEALSSDSFNANIICTQPRRIAATSIAERVAAERDEVLGRIVGYQIRLEGDMSHLTRLLFCTTGIVLRRLEGDPNLEGVTHIIVDEVHERSEQSDFLILVLKRLLVRRPELRVILMSATINAKLFSNYFDNCPVINIPGGTFPVKQFFLEDVIEKTRFNYEDKTLEHCSEQIASDEIPDSKLSKYQLQLRYPDYSFSTINTLDKMKFEKLDFNLIAHLLEWIVTTQHDELPLDGAILVFLPGYEEIENTYNKLLETEEFKENKDKYIIIPLHSSFSSDEQRSVFHKAKPGIRKIVLSTNIAETSITIDDVVYVVDVGRMKEMSYNHSRRMKSLDLIWVSRTNAEQRKGRAGRVQEGVCFHLFTSHMYKHILRPHPVPEIQRNSLEQVVLRIKMLSVFRGEDIELILQELIDPPLVERIHGAVQSLKEIGALDSQMELTALGYHLGSIPVDVRIGKLILYGTIFRCLDATLTMAAILSYKSPFVNPFKKRHEAKKMKLILSEHSSDIHTMLRAYKEWWQARDEGRAAAFSFCKKYFLSSKHLEMICALKQQYVEILSSIGFIRKGIKFKDVQTSATYSSDGVALITGKKLNLNNENNELLSAMLVVALYPNMAHGEIANFEIDSHLTIQYNDIVNIHPSSVNSEGVFEIGSLLVYHEKVRTSKVYIRECSLVSQLSVLMFAGGCIEVDVSKDPPLISIDDLIHYKTTQLEVALSLKALRSELNQLLSDEIKEPYKNLMSSPKGNAVIACVAQLLSDSTIPGVCNFFAYIELMGMMGTEDEEQQPQLSI